jgi:hypothetical protein
MLYPNRGPFTAPTHGDSAVLILILLLIGVTLAVLLWVGTVWFQGYIYSEPVPQAYWRAPAAALVITLFWAVWCNLNYRNPGKYPGQLQFDSGEDRRFDKLWAVRDGKETLYTMRKSPRGQPEYVDLLSGRPWQQHPDAILIEENPGERVRFEAERDKDGKFRIVRGSLRYVDERGREMKEDLLGLLTIRKGGLLFMNLFLNLVHLAVWFLALWLLLRFQWSHALGLAFVFWLLMTFTVLHMVLYKAEEAGRNRLAPTATDNQPR